MTRVPRPPALFVALLLASAAPVQAETLADALALAYRANPSLQQQRAQLRGLDEQHVEAAAGLRPTITAQVYGRYDEQRLGAGVLAQNRRQAQQAAQFGGALAYTDTINRSDTINGQVVLTQPLFNGGRTASALRQADNQIAAGREALRANEGDLLLNVIDAYVSVRRDLAVLDVRRTSVSRFRHQFEEAQARKAAGDATATDVSQAQAQYESERALYASAAQQLQSSRTSYTTYVGQNPGDLAPEPLLAAMPASVDQAFDVAEQSNPEMRQATQTEQASRAAVAVARAANRPSLSLQSSYGYNGSDGPYSSGGARTPITGENLQRNLTAEVVLTQPLYTGGQNGSAIRRALEQNNADRLAIEVTRRQVVQALSNAWNAMTIAQANVETQGRQVAAAQATFEGMQEEYRAGQRSTFDVLYTEQTLRDAQIQLLAARHDAYVASAAVLRYSGVLDIRTLTTDVPVYDPAANLRRVTRISALPFDPLLQALDSVAAPGAGQRPLAGPAPVAAPTLAPAVVQAAAPTAAEVVTTLPTEPRPGTAVDGARSPPPAAPPLRGLIRDDPTPGSLRDQRTHAPPSPVAPAVADALAGRAP